jgi:dCTP deaminase
MMAGFLSDRDILEAISTKKISIEPFSEENLGSWTYDVQLGNHFKIPKYNKIKFIDPRKDKSDLIFEEIFIEDGGELVLHPHRFVLASTKEYVKLDNLHVCLLEGRSSFARWGIVPHVQAGIGEPGWEGQYTLEILNLNEVPVILRPGDKIAQIFFARLTSEAEKPYHKKKLAKYQAQRGPTGSRLFSEFQK